MDPELLRRIDRWRREEELMRYTAKMTDAPRPRRARRLRGAVRGMAGVGRGLGRGLAGAWRRQAELAIRLAEAQQPWRTHGPLRWEGRGRRSRLVGAYLPRQSAPPSGGDPATRSEPVGGQ